MNSKLDAREQLHTVNDWIRWMASQMQAAEIYFGHGTDNAWDEAAQLVLWSIATPWERLTQIGETRLTLAERDTLLDILDQRIKGRMPAPYITGEAYFMGHKFIVDENVLIPRSPIAELVENEFAPWLAEEPQTILDLCCGSGCIGIAAGIVFPDTEVTLADVSQEALAIAKQNIVMHRCENNVRLVHSDLFSALDPQENEFDIIVCNPPYVGHAEMATLPREYQAEPEIALISGEDGLDCVNIILRQAGEFLSDLGILVLELGNSWETLEKAYPNVPFTWLEFEHGGYGVCIFSRDELSQYF